MKGASDQVRYCPLKYKFAFNTLHCTGDDVYCFLAGDPRVNEQTVLAVIHLLMHREHNR